MGLQDREYYRENQPGGGFGLGTRSVVFLLIIANAIIWLVQVASIRAPGMLEGFACRPSDVFYRGHIWQLVTANFLHSADNVFHLGFNMLQLYIFGRELESLYGRRDFLVFYLLAGIMAMLAQSAWGLFVMGSDVATIGASGCVSGVIFLFALHFPRRELLLMGIIKIEAWMLCALFLFANVLGEVGRFGGVAFMAHLGGAGFGVLYKVVDLRWDSIRRRFLPSGGRRRRRLPGDRVVEQRRGGAEIIDIHTRQPEESTERDPISARIDILLDKISSEGKESLSEEELEFLQENSQFYRSEG